MGPSGNNVRHRIFRRLACQSPLGRYQITPYRRYEARMYQVLCSSDTGVRPKRPPHGISAGMRKASHPGRYTSRVHTLLLDQPPSARHSTCLCTAPADRISGPDNLLVPVKPKSKIGRCPPSIANSASRAAVRTVTVDRCQSEAFAHHSAGAKVGAPCRSKQSTARSRLQLTRRTGRIIPRWDVRFEHSPETRAEETTRYVHTAIACLRSCIPGRRTHLHTSPSLLACARDSSIVRASE